MTLEGQYHIYIMLVLVGLFFTTIDGLFINDLCENKIAVSCDVQTEMDRLRGEGKLSLSVTPVYNVSQISFKACFPNARS